MQQQAIVPEGENLRRAVRWISEQGLGTLEVINEASQRFDLSPLEEEFLIRHFLQAEAKDLKTKLD